MGTPMAPLDFTLSYIKRSNSQGHSDFESLYLAKEPLR